MKTMKTIMMEKDLLERLKKQYYGGYSTEIEETSEEKLEKIPIEDIEKFLRKKKLENIKRNG